MSSLRKTNCVAGTTYPSSLSEFTLSVWFSLNSIGTQQRIFSIGQIGTSTPNFQLRVLNPNGLLALIGTGLTTWTVGQLYPYRLYHVLITSSIANGMQCQINCAGNSSLFVPSQNGTTQSHVAINLAGSNCISIGASHSDGTSLPFNGNIFGIYFSTHSAGTISQALPKFEHTTGLKRGQPKLIGPYGPINGILPEVLFGYNQTLADWTSMNNKGSLTFNSYTAGGGQAETSLATKVVNSDKPWLPDPYAANTTHFYCIPNGQYLMSVDKATRLVQTPLIKGSSGPSGSYVNWLRQDGTTPLTPNGSATCAGFYGMWKTINGHYLIEVLENTTNIRRWYRSDNPNVASWTTLAARTPVLTLGSASQNGTTGANPVTVGRMSLGNNTFVHGTYRGAPAMYFGEYGGARDAGTGSNSGTIWYSVDDGVTWLRFWRFDIDSNAPANQNWRYVHSLSFNSGVLCVAMNGNTISENTILLGSTDVYLLAQPGWTWNTVQDGSLGIGNMSRAQLSNWMLTWFGLADYFRLIYDGCNWITESGGAVTAPDSCRALTTLYDGMRVFYGNESSFTASTRPNVGIYVGDVWGSEGNTLLKVFSSPNMLGSADTPPGGGAQAGGWITKVGDTYVNLDYLNPAGHDGQNSANTVDLRTSKDGYVWTTVAKFNVLDVANRPAITHQWHSFVEDGELILSGTMAQYLTGSTLSPVLKFDGPFMPTDSIQTLNKPS